MLGCNAMLEKTSFGVNVVADCVSLTIHFQGPQSTLGVGLEAPDYGNIKKKQQP